jgi:hypothetical protein
LKSITYAAAVIAAKAMPVAVLDTTTYAAAVVAANRRCPSQVEDDHLRRSSGRCEQAMPGRKLKTTTYAAAVVAANSQF